MPINTTKNDENITYVSKRKTILRLFSYLKDYKGKIIVVLILMFLCVGVEILNPMIIEKALDDYILPRNYSGLIRLSVAAIVLNLLLIVCVRIRMLMMAKISNRLVVTIRNELYSHIQTLDFQFFDSRPIGKILARVMGNINSLKDVLSNTITTLIPDLLTILAVLIVMLVKNPLLALGGMVSLPLLLAGSLFIEIRSHKLWQINNQKASNMHAYIHEDLAGIRVIQGFGAETETKKTFDRLCEEDRNSFLDAVRYNDGYSSLCNICFALGLIGMYMVGFYVLGPSRISVGLFLAFGTYISKFWQPIINLSSFYTQLVTNLSSAERIFEIIDTEPKIKDRADVIPLPEITGCVDFEHVSFAYDENTKVLSDVSFHIQPSETIALVGPTGAGKTTIINLISRFYDIQEGSVKIDGYDVRDVSIESLRKQLGIMTQDNFLFSGTIMENIRYGRLNATDEEVIEAAKLVNAHEFIMKLKDGYQTELSERGGGLSIGQKQLLAFARTMISRPKILILDEATSSIDTHTEILVQKGIETLLRGRTSFVIAHRLSTIQKADRIFVIDHGGIVEQGSPAELMQKKGAYYDLYTAQFKEVI